MSYGTGQTPGENLPTVAEVLDRLPADSAQSIQEWPFGDLLLRSSVANKLHVSFSTVDGSRPFHVAGLVDGLPEEHAESAFTLEVKGKKNTQWANVMTPDAPRFKQLSGLAVHALVEAEQLETYIPTLRLQEVRGIQRPLKPGDEKGLARGEVVEVYESASRSKLTRLKLRVGADDPLVVRWADEDTSSSFHDQGLLTNGALVALHLTRDYSIGPNRHNYALARNRGYLLQA
jgi:hypothetical protein